jgi:hypothetical protein
VQRADVPAVRSDRSVTWFDDNDQARIDDDHHAPGGDHHDHAGVGNRTRLGRPDARRGPRLPDANAVHDHDDQPARQPSAERQLLLAREHGAGGADPEHEAA